MARRNPVELTPTETIARLEAIKKTAKSSAGMTRRAALASGARAVAGKFLLAGAGGWVFIAWDGLKARWAAEVEVNDLFPRWAEVQVVPGRHHPIDGYPPDVKIALDRLTPLIPRSHPVVTVGLDHLPSANLAGELVLIGGPVANMLSRQLHGYRFSNNKLSVRPMRKTGFRWCFSYPYRKAEDPHFSRYIGGELRETMPKAIIDLHGTGPMAVPRFSAVDPESGKIRSDFLLLTVTPNTLLRYSSGSSIVDVTDLQGQADKVFADLLLDDGRRVELAKAVRRKRHFQALYEVPVMHDDRKRETRPGVPTLIDVHVL